MSTFHIVTDVINVRRDIYQLKLATRKTVFFYSKTGPTPV